MSLPCSLLTLIINNHNLFEFYAKEQFAVKLTTKTRYGTRAMLEIARAYPDRSVKRKEISITQEVSSAYLENILTSLKEAGVITAQRGANGGFRLAQRPETITLLQIITALEGTIAPVDCAENPESCGRSNCCTTFRVWQSFHTAQQKFFQNITLRDLIEMGRSPDKFVCEI